MSGGRYCCLPFPALYAKLYLPHHRAKGYAHEYKKYEEIFDLTIHNTIEINNELKINNERMTAAR